jgi:hypothetical protein
MKGSRKYQLTPINVMNFSTSELRLIALTRMMNQWMDIRLHAAVKEEESLFETVKNHDV